MGVERTMKDNSDEEGDKVTSGRNSECQSDENGVKDNTGLENPDAEFLSGSRVRIDLTFHWRGNHMMMAKVFRAGLRMPTALYFAAPFRAGRIERCDRRILKHMTIDISKVSGGSEFDEENNDCSGHGNRTRCSGISRDPEIWQARIG